MTTQTTTDRALNAVLHAGVPRSMARDAAKAFASSPNAPSEHADAGTLAKAARRWADAQTGPWTTVRRADFDKLPPGEQKRIALSGTHRITH